MKLVRILLVLCLLFTMASCSSKPNCGPLDETDDLPTFYHFPDLHDPSSETRYGHFCAGWRFESGRRIALYATGRMGGYDFWDVCVDDGDGWRVERFGQAEGYLNPTLPRLYSELVDNILFVGENIGVITGGDGYGTPRFAASYTLDGGVTWQNVFNDEGDYALFGTRKYGFGNLIGFEAAPEGENIRLTFRSVMGGTEYRYSALLTKDGLKADTSK